MSNDIMYNYELVYEYLSLLLLVFQLNKFPVTYYILALIVVTL